MTAAHDRKVFLPREILRHLIVGSARHAGGIEGAAAGIVERRERISANSWNTQLLPPVLADSKRCAGLLAAVHAKTRLKNKRWPEYVCVGDHGVDLIAGRHHAIAIQQFPVERDGISPRSVARVRVAAEEAVVLVENMVDLRIPARAVGPILRFRSEVLVRTRAVDEPRATQVIGLVPWLKAEKLRGDRVESASGNYVVREGVAHPLACGVLPRRGRIENRETLPAEGKVASQHGVVRHVGKHLLIVFLVVPRPSK